MKGRIWSYVVGFAGVVAGVFALLAFAFELEKRLPVSGDLGIAITSLGLALAAGLLSAYWVGTIRKLSRTKRVFLSYPYESTPIAQEIKDTLSNAKVKVWIDFENLTPGEFYRDSIKQAISDADALVVLLHGGASKYIEEELEFAREKGVRIIPVVIGDTPIPVGLSDLVYLDLRDDKQAGLTRLLDLVT